MRVRASYEAELGPVGTFLPEKTPSHDLPGPFRRYAAACLELPERHPSDCGGVRDWLDAEFGVADPAVTAAIPALSTYERDALMTVLCFLAHAYRWDTIPPHEARFQERQIALPPAIAQPWAELARLLDQPRVGSLWAMVLCNWSLSGFDGGSTYDPLALEYETLRVRYSWVPAAARNHLERFVLTFVLLEARGSAVLGAIVAAFEAAAREDVQEAAYQLDKLAAAIEAFTEPLVTTIRRPLVEPQIFIDFLQPSWAWDADGVGDLQGGPSGLQLGTLHALDAALSIDGTGEFAAARRAALVYLPTRHRRFLSVLTEYAPLLRRFVDDSNDAALKWRFNDCVRAVRVFRVIHMKRGSHYLRAGAETGEGRVTTGIALEGRGDPVVAEFERLMSERLEDTAAALVEAPPEGLELPTLETALRFLTEEERELLFDPADVRRYAAGETVIGKGDRRQALYVIRDGSALVDAEGVPVLLGPGDVFGELSFLSNEGAAASVVAVDELEAGVLERDRLYRLLVEQRDLAGRFYHSLAVLVASRLRAARSQLSALRPEDIPAPPSPASEMPSTKVRERIDELVRREDLAALVDFVAEHHESGAYIRRRAYAFLTEEAALAAVLEGPGARQRDDRAIARILDGELDLPYCNALRARRQTVASLLRELGDGPVCGLETLPPAEFDDAGIAATIISTDREAATIPVNIVHAARGAIAIRLEPQRLIYMSTLAEYLDERDLVRVLDWIHGHLQPGGMAVVGNAPPDARDAAFWEHVLGWKLIRRTPTRLVDAFSRSDFGAALVEMIADEDRGGILAFASRRE